MECLVTKLKESVNADLLKIGEVRINVNNYDINDPKYGESLILASTVNQEMKTIGGIFMDINKDSIGASLNLGNDEVYYPSPNAVISIPDKYNLKTIRQNNGNVPSITLNIEQLKYCNSLKTIMLGKPSVAIGSIKGLSSCKSLEILEIVNSGGIEGSLSYISNFPMLKTLNLNYCKTITGDIAEITGCPLLVNIRLSGNGEITGYLKNTPNKENIVNFDVSETKISGDISDFNSFNVVKSINTTNCINISGNIESFKPKVEGTFNFINTSINGSANIFFDNLVGRFRGTLTIYVKGTSVTYNGGSVTTGLRATVNEGSVSVTVVS